MRRLIVPSVMAVVGHGAAFALLRSGTSSSGRTRSSPPAGLLAGRTLPEPSVFATEQARVRVVTMTDGLVQLLARGPRRIRDVRQGPDGLLYVLTDAGALLRLEPAP